MRNDVRRRRGEQGLTQGELAEAMGVSRQTINAIETERYTPSLPLALALARYFGTTVGGWATTSSLVAIGPSRSAWRPRWAG